MVERRQSYDQRDQDDDAAGIGDDVQEVFKPAASSEQDEVMIDVESRVSDKGADGGVYVDLFRDGADCGREGGDLQSRVSREENEGLGSRSDLEQLNDQSSGVNGEDDPIELSVSVSGSDVREEESDGEGVDLSVSRYDSLLAKFDNYASGGVGSSSSSRASTFGFRVGDMVWGKVKSHPWWPGHIFNEAFATTSVRRTRREGHILVAFYGDSSYGWFDPAELVPFDAHFAEKSRQTTVKSFVKAVEEAVDEVCRRSCVGLSCRCRNPQNFRPANVEGYFAVDLGDYDYVAVYPQTLIDHSRDGFRPLETVRFMSQLARRPLDSDQKSLDLSKNKAVAMALRKALFEEFDDTYSEAFGYPAERPSRAPTNFADDSLRVQAQAQLSGRLVIAEALRGKKSSNKSVKLKDKPKKNKYLLKRRTESDDSKKSQVHNRQLDSSASFLYVEGESELASAEYVLQRRSPTTSIKTHLLSTESVESLDQANLKASLKNQNDVLSEMKASSPHEAIKNESSLQNEAEKTIDFNKDKSAQVVQDVKDMLKTQDISRIMEATQSLQPVSSAVHLEAEGLGSGKKVVIKKPKAPKRSIVEVNSDKVIQEEKKKKKKKKKMKKEMVEGHPEKRVATGKADPLSSLVYGKENDGASTLSPGDAVNKPQDAPTNLDLKFQDVLSDLKILALDPFHGAEGNSPVVAKQIFLKFRSLVFQKSLLLAPVMESEFVNAAERSNSATIGSASDIVRSVNGKDKFIKKPAKLLGRPDDPTKGGRKRPLSDRQEEIATKKSKKISDIRSLANEKKAGHKILEPERKEKETSILGQPRMTKAGPPSGRVQAPPPRVPEPTMLVLKFPQGTAMPTVAALKARFARFGPLDLDSMRVFWQSSTCRVVFRYKSDAQKAYEFAVSSTSLFGNGNIRCQIREVGVPEPETKEETKEEAYPELPRYEPPLPPPSLVKSILKKPSGDEAGQAPPQPSTGRATSARVKFVLDGEEGGRGEQPSMMASRSSVASYAGPSASSGPVDISQQMLSLLTRCQEVVTNFKAYLGYVPYHSL
uniref:PWWP domain-containing protein n=1 Tax=Kalanchoe fedtschenkoi TaxID=63787 RepID=A0A7N0SV17_KALFE